MNNKLIDICYNSLNRYFDSLINRGYVSLREENKVLALITIEEMVNCDFRGDINKEDYDKISNALYSLFGTSCLIPFPEYITDMDRIHIGDITELANRVEAIENTVVIKPNPEEPSGISVDDSNIII